MMKWIFLFILLMARVTSAAEPLEIRGNCGSAYRLISASDFPVQPISRWMIESMDLFVQPEQLLPRDFLRELEKEGMVKTALRQVSGIHLPNGKTGPGLELSIIRGEDTILTLTLSRDAEKPDRFILSNFEAGNPDINPYREEYLTRQALLPGNVSVHLKKQLFALAKAGGAKTIELTGPSNFLTLQRARRDGFRPVSGKSQKTIEALEALYKLGRKTEVIDSPEHFAEGLGTQLVLSHDLLMHQTLHKAWQEYQKTKNPEGETTRIHFEDGKPVLFEMERGEDTWFGILDPLSAEPQLLEWRQLLSEGRLRMERDLQ